MASLAMARRRNQAMTRQWSTSGQQCFQAQLNRRLGNDAENMRMDAMSGRAVTDVLL